MKILTLYFSGTGNTKFVVDQIDERLTAASHDFESLSIEVFVDSDIEKIQTADVLMFAYPVYGSMAPMIMWKFIKKYAEYLEDKKAHVIATQLMFSGDGGAYLARILRKCRVEILSIEHFNMPSNLSDLKVIKTRNGIENKNKMSKTMQRIELYCRDFERNAFFKIGDNLTSTLLGSMQRIPFAKWERKLAKDVKIDHQLCTLCNQCVEHCPMHNLHQVDGKIEQDGNCTLCYRCVNLCPVKTISIMSKKKPVVQYKGLK